MYSNEATWRAVIQIGLYVVVLALLTKPLDLYMTRVYSGERTFADRVLRPVERGIYRLTGVDETREMRWTTYAIAMLAFNLVGVLALYLIHRANYAVHASWSACASLGIPATRNVGALSTSMSSASSITASRSRVAPRSQAAPKARSPSSVRMSAM